MRATKKNATKTAAKSSKVAKTSKRQSWSDDVKIIVAAKENPGLEGSAAFKIWEALKSCKTVGAVKAKAKRLEKREGHVIGLLRYWTKRGEVKVAA